jgi:ribosomal-protein-alanine N-acetyltransferase
MLSLNKDFFLKSFPRLETDRLILREMTHGDAEAVFKLFSDEAVTQTMDIYKFETIERAHRLINLVAERYRRKEGLRWGITFKDDNRIIGTAGFNYLDDRTLRGEIGYDLEQAQWGKGLTTEAVRAVLKFGFATIGLNRIEATTNLHNIASIKVLYKLGFKEEGIMREYGYWREEFQDLRMFSLLKREFK